MFELLSLLSYDPIKMVVSNILVVSFTLFILIIYKYIYPKKEITPQILAICISILPLVSIFRHGSYESGDMTINAIKSMSFYESLTEGNFIPRWAEKLNATYGYPNFVFAYPLPYYLTSLFHRFGFSFINSTKLLLIITYLGSGYFMYSWAKQHLSKNSSLLTSIFFLYAPYHLVDMHFRVSIGEMTALLFIPASLFFVNKYIKKPSNINLFFSSVVLTLLILSHQIVSLLTFPIIFIYSLLIRKSKTVKTYLQTITPFIFSILISSYYWLPVIVLGKYTHQSLYLQQVKYYPLSSFIYSPWKFGLLFQGAEGKFVTIIGYIQLIVIIYSLYLLITNKIINKLKYLLIFNLLVLIIFLFLSQNSSQPIYSQFPILKSMQFSYRVMNVIIFPASLIPGIIYDQFKSKKLFWVLVLAVSITTILNWGNRGMDLRVNDNYLRNYLPYSTANGEGLHPATPKWVDPYDPWQEEIPMAHLEVLNGNAAIKELFRNSVNHNYKVIVNEPTQFKENTYYFPGWSVMANGQKVNIDYDNPSYPGIILFNLPEGEYKIAVVYNNTSIEKYSFMMSSLALFSLAILLIKRKNNS
jgi:hypothetical protein